MRVSLHFYNRKVTFITCYELVKIFILKPDMDMSENCAFMRFPIQKERGRQTKLDGGNSLNHPPFHLQFCFGT